MRGNAGNDAFPHYPHPLLLRRFFLYYKYLKET